MEFGICERGTAACNIGVDTHSSRWANQILLAKFEICTHNYANASAFSAAAASDQRPPPPRDTVKLHSGCTWQPPPYSSNHSIPRNLDKSSANKYTRLNKYSAAMRQHPNLGGKFERACAKGAFDGRCFLPISAFLPLNFAAVHCSFVPAKTAAD